MRIRSRIPLQRRLPRAPDRGFTLVELMVVVVIVTVLAAIALPSYQKYVMKSRRAEALSALSAIAQAQERWRSNNSSYADTLAALGLGGTTTSGAYSLTLAGVGNPATFASGYEAHAVPTSAGRQANDSECSDIFIEMRAGQLLYRDTNSASTASSPVCWPQ